MSRSGQLTLRVYITDRDSFEITTRLIDHNVWDVTRAKHGWPKPDEAPMTWLGFLAWSAARRTGAIEPALTWDEFLKKCESVENISDDDDANEPDPTQPGPGPG